MFAILVSIPPSYRLLSYSTSLPLLQVVAVTTAYFVTPNYGKLIALWLRVRVILFDSKS